MKLNNKRTILVGLAFLSISAFWQLYDSVVPLVLKKNTRRKSDPSISNYQSEEEGSQVLLLPTRPASPLGCVNRLRSLHLNVWRV